jgi:hypothetical protein
MKPEKNLGTSIKSIGTSDQIGIFQEELNIAT